jgi:hypothetical protein
MPYKISYLEPVATVRPVTRLNDSAATWLLWRRRRRPIVNDISRKDIPDHPLAKGRVGHSLGFKKWQDLPGQILIGVFGSRDLALRHADDLRGCLSMPGSVRNQDQKDKLGTNVTNPLSRIAPVTANNFASLNL